MRDVFLFNCVQLAFDVTHGWERLGKWISRDENTLCDSLAREAVTTNTWRVEAGGDF